MKRYIVQVARMRMADVVVGDIINRNPDDARGWFQVAGVSLLHNGTLALFDEGSQNTATGKGYDILGVQIAKPIEVPDDDPYAAPVYDAENAAADAKAMMGSGQGGDDADEDEEAVQDTDATADTDDTEEGEGGGWALGDDKNEAETEAKKRRSSVFS